MMFPFTKRVVDRIENVMNSQDSFGLEKYGKPLDPLDDYDWLGMAEEELADALKYFNAEREKRNAFIESVIKELTHVKRCIGIGNLMGAEAITDGSIKKLESLIKKR